LPPLHQNDVDSERIRPRFERARPASDAAIALLDDKPRFPSSLATAKEATARSRHTQLRTLEERLIYLRELEELIATILKSVSEQRQADA
jgi:uncharacterized protein